MQELKELQASQSRDFAASVLEVRLTVCQLVPMQRSASTPLLSLVCAHAQDNLFEWHFVVRGPLDTEFEVCHCALPSRSCASVLCVASLCVSF